MNSENKNVPNNDQTAENSLFSLNKEQKEVCISLKSELLADTEKARANRKMEEELESCSKESFDKELIPDEMEEKLKYLKIWAEKGEVEAQIKLGDLYANGATGLEPNGAEAVKWYKKATERSSLAQFRLTQCYATGTGIEQNEDEAIKWYSRSVEKECNPYFLNNILTDKELGDLLVFLEKGSRKTPMRRNNVSVIPHFFTTVSSPKFCFL